MPVTLDEQFSFQTKKTLELTPFSFSPQPGRGRAYVHGETGLPKAG